jgi:hypothetical protein
MNDAAFGIKPASSTTFVQVPIIREYDRVERLLKLIGKRKAFICGGYARFVCSQREKPKACYDVDIYCHDEKTYKAMLNVLKKAGFVIKEENVVCVVYKKEDTINRPVQLIKPVKDFKMLTVGKMEDILANFDFTVARAGILSSKHVLVDIDFPEDDKNANLVVKNIHCPISSSIRMMKYAKKGYMIRPREVFKLFLDWEARPIEYKQEIIELFAQSDAGIIDDVDILKLERLLRRD